MTPFRRVLSVLLLLLLQDMAHAQHRKDAAEAVQEGSVANWMEYYKRERGTAPAGQKPSPKPAPAPDASGAAAPAR